MDEDDLDYEPMIYDNSVYDYKNEYAYESKAIIYYKDGKKEILKTK